MKTKNIFKLVTLLFLALTFNSCVEDGDYEIPTVTIEDPNLTATNDIQSILDLYKEGEVVDLSTLSQGNGILEGYVVSSDETGNIYKSIAIQDKPENPTAAVQIIVDATKTGLFYQVGRKVFVKLKGLGLSEYKGTLQIGKLNGAKVERISAADYKQVIVRSPELAEVTPLVINSIEEITDANISMLIQLNDMRAVNKDETYSDPKSKYPLNRTIENCENKQTIAMRNSNYATFATDKIPNKRGSIVAILGKYNKTFQLFIRGTEDVKFTEAYECDSSGGGSTGGTFTPKTVTELNETFDSVENGKEITLEGWFSEVEEGDRNWQGKEFSGNKFMSVSGFKAKDAKIVSWIVTPGLDLSKATNKNFTFESQRGYAKNENLEVLVSSDFDHEKGAAAATWEVLSPTLADKNAGGYSDFKAAGDLDLSSYSGVVYVAFKYVGNNSDATGTINIDNVKFNYEGGSTGGGTTAEKTLADVRALFTGSEVTITDDAKIKVIVTSDASIKNIDSRNAFAQDATGGIALRFDNAHSLKLGEEVEISIKDLTLTEYNGLLQLNLTNDNVLSQTAATLPEPKVITLTEALTGDYEGQFVKIEGVQFKDNTKTYLKNNTLTNCKEELNLYVRDGATFSAEQVADKKGSITGVMTDFKGAQLYLPNTSNVNFTEEYMDCSSTGGGSGGGATTDTDLFISEYVEGSSNNKYIEIYNGTGADVDLSKYQVWGSSNGSGWKDARQVQLSGTLANGEVYVISTDQADAAILAEADLKLPYESPVHFNGDDAIAIAKENTSGTYEVIDVIGTPEEDPGTAWGVAGVTNATKDHTLIRKSSVTKGNTDWAKSAGTDAASSEWEVKDKDDFSSVGKK